MKLANPIEETLAFEAPQPVMEQFESWLTSVSTGRPLFVSDSNGFDWQWIKPETYPATLSLNTFPAVNTGTLVAGI